MLAWIMKTPFAINLIQKWSYDYIKMDCEGGKCYGVLAVRMNVLLFITSADKHLVLSVRCTVYVLLCHCFTSW